jgi:glucose-fructose oxidoreductase
VYTLLEGLDAANFREVLARADIDAVMVATPDHWHVPIAIDAAKASKHVSKEPPVPRTSFGGPYS